MTHPVIGMASAFTSGQEDAEFQRQLTAGRSLSTSQKSAATIQQERTARATSTATATQAISQEDASRIQQQQRFESLLASDPRRQSAGSGATGGTSRVISPATIPTASISGFLGNTPEERAASRRIAELRNENDQINRAMRAASGGGGALPFIPGATFTQNFGPMGSITTILGGLPQQGAAGAAGIAGSGTAGIGAGGVGGGAGSAFLDELRQDVEAANAATEADRERAFAAIEEFKQTDFGFGPEQIAQIESNTRQNQNANNEMILRRVREQFANIGRVASPLMMGQIAKRLALQSEDVIATQRAGLQIESASLRLNQQQIALRSLTETLSSTTRQTLDPSTILQIQQLIGRGSSQVAPFRV